MADTFTYEFNTDSFKHTSRLNTGLFIGGKFVAPVEGGAKIDVVNPATGKVITAVSAGTGKDVDVAYEVALKAYKNSWGLKVPGKERGRLLWKLADLVEKHSVELAAWESLNMGIPFGLSKAGDVAISVDGLRYFAGWADKIHGQTIEVNENKFAYTRHEPYGVVGTIIPWNVPLALLVAKIAPILATGNVVILKPSEITPLTALKVAELIVEAGFPPGVVNIVNGYGHTVGQAISEHPQIPKLSFTGSTLTGRKIQVAAAQSNLKVVTLELGGKSPSIIFDDADLEQAVKWASRGLFANTGQLCIAGSRIFVQEGIYDKFLAAFTGATQFWDQAIGDPFAATTLLGPLVSQAQFDRVLGYIESGKAEGAKVHAGGARHGNSGYYVQPTIFTDTRPDMKIVKEEIFGPVGVLIKFKTEEEAIEMANNTEYGLACGVFTTDNSRAVRVTHALEAGIAWINSWGDSGVSLPFGGFKQSGYGREMGQYALDTYTRVKAVQVNVGEKL